MKKISIIALILVIAMSLTACVNDEQKLFNAFSKMQDISSMDSSSEISFNLNAEGFPEDQQANIEQVMALINMSKLTLKQRMVQNEDKTVAKAKVDMNLNVQGLINEDISIWVDTDMSGDSPEIFEVIKIPAMLMGFITPDPAKEYLVYDMSELMNSTSEEINFNELMEWSKELQPKMEEYFKDMVEKFKPGFEIVKEKEKRIVDGKNLTIYELTIDDAELKDLIRYTGNYFMDDEDTMEFIKEYMDVVINMVNLPEEEKAAAIEEINAELEKIEKEMPNIKAKFNTFMDTYKDVTILGEKGIVIEFGINEKGYITHEAGTIDFRIDIGQIAKLLGEEAKGVLNLEINYKSRAYNINNKVIRVELPKVDENNSIDVMQMLEAQMTNMNDFMPVETEAEPTLEAPQLP
ncbi:hypothetical protein [Tissierella sp.]|uniref:hypothetical protein n=1 Tax=Tissierella sp. TaxID=41274 RepID=UPI00286712B4|nr:hypothetical protein [Tissierella sp.]MDR7857576.1 hypothetical protein [Tissierella sp.]